MLIRLSNNRNICFLLLSGIIFIIPSKDIIKDKQLIRFQLTQLINRMFKDFLNHRLLCAFNVLNTGRYIIAQKCTPLYVFIYEHNFDATWQDQVINRVLENQLNISQGWLSQWNRDKMKTKDKFILLHVVTTVIR